MRTTWQDCRDYIKVLNNAYQEKNKERFKKLLGYVSLHSFVGSPALRDEFLGVVAKGIELLGK